LARHFSVTTTGESDVGVGVGAGSLRLHDAATTIAPAAPNPAAHRRPAGNMGSTIPQDRVP
jgi:hypothetical protein